jgi:hypothetical protein
MSWNQFNTAYNVFYAHFKNEITRLNPTKTNTEITRLISEKWRILSDDEKAEYEIRAKRDGLEYITDVKKRSALIDDFGAARSVEGFTSLIRQILISSIPSNTSMLLELQRFLPLGSKQRAIYRE